MENNKKPKKKEYHFNIICFTIDKEKYQPLIIIKKYLSLEQCSNIKYSKENIEYDHSTNPSNGRMTKCHFTEILDTNKISNKCSLADSYLIFIDLESDEIETETEEILYYIKTNGKEDLKYYFIGVYLDMNNVSCLNNKEEMNEYFDSKKINYEYTELDFNSTDDLVKILNHITNDTLKNKEFESLNKTLEKKDPSYSACDIF